MPAYSFTCLKCNRFTERFLAINDRNNKQKCKIKGCGGVLARAIDNPPSLLGFNNLGQSK